MNAAAGGDHAGCLTDGLHHHVFEDGALAAGLHARPAEEDGHDGNGDGGLDGVACAKGHVDASGGKHHHHAPGRP